MHGLILKTIQAFVEHTYGRSSWDDIVARSGADVPEFEAMLSYDADLVRILLHAASAHLKKPIDAVLEDIGHYVVAPPHNEALRRLMRFGGDDFAEFLGSVEELPDRARLAIPDLELPSLELREFTESQFTLHVTGALPGFGHVLVGLLRAMADDYGALVLLDHQGASNNSELIEIVVISTQFSEGREFELAAAEPEVGTV